MTTTFENAQVGDKVYDVLLGEGIIEASITDRIFKVRLLNFPVESDLIVYYDVEGFAYDLNLKFRTTLSRALYWKEPEIIAPEQPKRKKKAHIEGWIITNPTTGKEWNGAYKGTIFYDYNESVNQLSDSPLLKDYRIIKFTTEEFEVEE